MYYDWNMIIFFTIKKSEFPFWNPSCYGKQRTQKFHQIAIIAVEYKWLGILQGTTPGPIPMVVQQGKFEINKINYQ